MLWVCWSVVSATKAGWQSRDWISGCIRASGLGLAGWDLHSPCQGTALICSGASLTWQRLFCFCLE